MRILIANLLLALFASMGGSEHILIQSFSAEVGKCPMTKCPPYERCAAFVETFYRTKTYHTTTISTSHIPTEIHVPTTITTSTQVVETVHLCQPLLFACCGVLCRDGQECVQCLCIWTCCQCTLPKSVRPDFKVIMERTFFSIVKFMFIWYTGVGGTANHCLAS